MKNIHILPTDKPSRLIINWEKDLCYKSKPYLMEGTQHIYITSDEEIKEGDWCYVFRGGTHRVEKAIHNDLQSWKKIILTTDQDLIKDGVQEIDDDFLEWFVKNPSCEEVIVTNLYGDFNPIEYYYETIISKEEPKQDKIMERFIANAKQETTFEEEAKLNALKQVMRFEPNKERFKLACKNSYLKGYRLAQETLYSEEEVLAFCEWFSFELYRYGYPTIENTLKALKQFKKK